MQNGILKLTTAALLVCGATTASAQQAPMMQQQAQPQQQQERTLQGAQRPGRGAEEDFDDDREVTGWHHGLGWRRDRASGRGDMDFGMMRGGAVMGAGRGMMMRMLFAMMDGDGDGTVSLQEFQAAHERIFKAMDANKDGKLTLEEIVAFMQGSGTPAPRE